MQDAKAPESIWASRLSGVKSTTGVLASGVVWGSSEHTSADGVGVMGGTSMELMLGVSLPSSSSSSQSNSDGDIELVEDVHELSE